MNKIYVNDGQEINLNDDVFSGLKEYILNNEDNFITKNGKYKINFVGLLEIVSSNEETISLFSFPKEYDYDQNNIKTDMKNVMNSIIQSDVEAKGLFEKQESKKYVNKIEIINQLIEYYNQYGVFYKRVNTYEKRVNGNINFDKTFKKFNPNSKNVFDLHIVRKKDRQYNIISHAMAYVIDKGTETYDFYFDHTITDFEYISYDVNYFIAMLYKELATTFKDIEIQLITNLINYFSNAPTDVSASYHIATCSYNVVFEHMVKYSLGESYEYQKAFGIGTTRYINRETENRKINVDHFKADKNTNTYHLIDSKYYRYNEKFNVDYKQLFYQYHIATEDAYKDIEISKWKNILIKVAPSGIDYSDDYTTHLKRKTDEVTIYEIYLDMKDIVSYYVKTGDKPRTLRLLEIIESL
jgi:hypothetical protein